MMDIYDLQVGVVFAAVHLVDTLPDFQLGILIWVLVQTTTYRHEIHADRMKLHMHAYKTKHLT